MAATFRGTAGAGDLLIYLKAGLIVEPHDTKETQHAGRNVGAKEGVKNINGRKLEYETGGKRGIVYQKKGKHILVTVFFLVTPSR